MGRVIERRSGTVRFEVDIDAGPERWGRPVILQVLASGERMPAILACEQGRIPSERQPVLSVSVRIDPAETSWVVLRVTDPDESADVRARPPYSELGGSLAYASPFFFRPAPPE
jgi:hypothetical protein